MYNVNLNYYEIKELLGENSQYVESVEYYSYSNDNCFYLIKLKKPYYFVLDDGYGHIKYEDNFTVGKDSAFLEHDFFKNRIIKRNN